MTESGKAPERIWINPCDPCEREYDYYVCHPLYISGRETPYVRADLYDAAQAEVASLTAALADAERRGAEKMQTRAANTAWAFWADKEAETSRDYIANAIRALPPRERDGQEDVA